MQPTTYILLYVAAFIPAIFYMLYIIAFDSKKPEPPLALIVAAVVGLAVALGITHFDLLPPIADAQGRVVPILWERIAAGSLSLAVPAELTKWVALLVFLALNKYYDEYIDGIVYAVCLAMGFAGVWSVWFVTEVFDVLTIGLWETCLFIIFVVIPIHLASSSMMGYFLALARTRHKFRNYLCSLLLPIIIDGILCSMVLMIGSHWEYYFVAGFLFSLLSMIFYKQAYRLLEMDGVRVNSK